MPDREPYPNAPLVIVALEVRFPDVGPITSQARALIRELTRDRLPLSEVVKEETINVAIGSQSPVVAPAVPVHVLRFFARDRTTSLVVNPAAMILETTSYQGYDDFRRLISITTGAIGEALNPDGILRVGLRYIDEIRVPAITELPGDWSGYIDDRLLAIVDPSLLEKTGLQPQLWQGVVNYSAGPDSTLRARYGPAEGYAVDPNGPTRRKNRFEPGPYFLLDSDSSWTPQDVPEFSVDTIIDACDRLHVPVRALFDAVSEDRLVQEVYKRR